jgi:hypothetical protein
LNCFWYYYKNVEREGFKISDLNPVKLVDKGLGKIVDSILGSIPLLKDIHKKVKKKSGLIQKIKTTFYELFISLLTIIFTPAAALLILFLAYNFMMFIISNSHLLFKPWASLKNI